MAVSQANSHAVYNSVPLPLGGTTCIRVIKIKPSTTPDFSDPIICEFSILDVDNGQLLTKEVSTGHCDLSLKLDKKLTISPSKVEYRALSYMWGDSPADHEIELHGTKFKIRKNLWDFLDQARRDLFPHYIWIDALCIDQSRIPERNHQVSMMGTVYSSAQRVIVWLGACQEMDLTAILQVTSAFKKEGTKAQWIVRQHWRALRKLYNNPYWSRAWIVQEYALAKSLDVWFGSISIRQEILSAKSPLPNDFVFTQKLRNSPAGKILQLRETRSIAQEDDQFEPLKKFLILINDIGSNVECADPRDKVYSLLSLLKYTERQELDIHPDYSKSPSELYASILGKIPGHTPGEWLLALDQLKSILNPVPHVRAVQLATLNLRSTWWDEGYHASMLYGVKDHRCARLDGHTDLQTIDINGCSNCALVPTIEAGPLPGFGREFSLPQWIQWARALMNSSKAADRFLGRRVAEDLIRIPDWSPVLQMSGTGTISWHSYHSPLLEDLRDSLAERRLSSFKCWRYGRGG